MTCKEETNKFSLRRNINNMINNMYYISFLSDDAEIFFKREMQELHKTIGELKELENED